MKNLENTMLDVHPCFSDMACEYARVHLPIAPKCNVKCNYCNRKFDCVNESRPGVTSKLMHLDDICKHIQNVQKVYNLSTVGIAGPGEPMANWDVVKNACEQIHDNFSSLNLCLSTNGLELDEHIEELYSLGVRFITITMNAVDMEISSKIYEHITIQNQCCSGIEACNYLYEKQLKALRHLKEMDIYVKINTVVMKGINESQIRPIAELVREYGCYVMNIIPLLPVAQTPFENLPIHSSDELTKLRMAAAPYSNIMTHCQRCRSDAVGYISCEKRKETIQHTNQEEL